MTFSLGCGDRIGDDVTSGDGGRGGGNCEKLMLLFGS